LKVPWVTLVIAVVATALIAGCGSDDSSDSSGDSGMSAEKPTRGFDLRQQLVSICEGAGGKLSDSPPACLVGSSQDCDPVKKAKATFPFPCMVWRSWSQTTPGGVDEFMRKCVQEGGTSLKMPPMGVVCASRV
jgi:hypothetical protein